MRILLACLLLLVTLIVAIRLSTAKPENSAIINGGTEEPQTIEWIDLIPKDAVNLLQPATLIDHKNLSKIELDKDKNAKRIATNSSGKNFGVIMQNTPNTLDSTNKMTLKDVLVSTGVRREYSNQKIRLAGYVVPLEYNDNHELTAFFFAPYFGACTHVPPPAPNQLIYVRSPKGIKIAGIFDPFWLTGILHIETTETEETVLGISSYSLDAESLGEYKND